MFGIQWLKITEKKTKKSSPLNPSFPARKNGRGYTQ